MDFLQNNRSCPNTSGNLVYLTKVFYDNTENSSPILTNLLTTPNVFTQHLTVGNDICDEDDRDRDRNRDRDRDRDRNHGCGCDMKCDCDHDRDRDRNRERDRERNRNRDRNRDCDCCCNLSLSPNTTFDITNAFAIVHSFTLAGTAPLTPEDITVDGLPITALSSSGGQFMGDLSGIMAEITKCPCVSPCANVCPGNFVLISARGPWNLRATIVLEGTLFENGVTCQFRVCFTTAEGVSLPITGPAAFAFCGVDIPCQIAGIAPSLLFDFDACAAILNPMLEVTRTNNGFGLALRGSLVVTPEADLKVIRSSLFRINADEVEKECDDVGQCSPCNPHEADCFEPGDNCCCGQKRPRPGSINAACQCCDTNGFTF